MNEKEKQGSDQKCPHGRHGAFRTKLPNSCHIPSWTCPREICQRQQRSLLPEKVFRGGDGDSVPLWPSLEAGDWNHTSGERSLPSGRQGYHIACDFPTAFSSNSQDTCFQKYLFLCFNPPRSPEGGHSLLGEQQQQGGPYKREQRQNCEKWTWTGRGIVCTQCLQYLYLTACPQPASVSS